MKKALVCGAGGFIGGVLTSSTFLYLRLDQYFALRAVKEAPQPEYPSAWTYLVPLAWFLTSAVVVALSKRLDICRKNSRTGPVTQT